MKYEHVISYVARTPWAIAPEKMQDLLAVLAFRAAGYEFTQEELRARLGDEPPAPPDPKQRGAVAILPLRGVIAHRMGSLDESSGGMSAERFTKMVQQAAADPSVGTILLDVDSPGGTVPGVMEAADAVYAARQSKKVVAIANSMMASAAYWIASQAEELVAIPSALDRVIGSVGVFTVHQDLTAALEKQGIKVTVIKSGENKFEGNPFEPLTEETRAAMQASVDAANEKFVKAVARGRGVTAAVVRQQFGDGRAFPAADAKNAGLIDKIATFDETVARLAGRKASTGLRAEADPQRMRSSRL